MIDCKKYEMIDLCCFTQKKMNQYRSASYVIQSYQFPKVHAMNIQFQYPESAGRKHLIKQANSIVIQPTTKRKHLTDAFPLMISHLYSCASNWYNSLAGKLIIRRLYCSEDYNWFHPHRNTICQYFLTDIAMCGMWLYGNRYF